LNTTSVGALSGAQIGVLTSAQFAGLTSAQFAALTSTQLAGLKTSEIGWLGFEQAQGITPTEIGWLSSPQVKALKTQDGANQILTADARTALSHATAPNASLFAAAAATLDASGSSTVSLATTQNGPLQSPLAPNNSGS